MPTRQQAEQRSLRRLAALLAKIGRQNRKLLREVSAAIKK